MNGVLLEDQKFISGGYDKLHFDGFHYASSEPANPEGTSVINVFYDRDIMTVAFFYTSQYDQYAPDPNTLPAGASLVDAPARPYEVTESTESTEGTQYGFVDGEYKPLTRTENDLQTYVIKPGAYCYTPYTGTVSEDVYGIRQVEPDPVFC